ncbi:hypothetical protein TTHERM_00058810 (macronuclear) [Tetrahymena thermophila SB210]|uniref:Uncharacterized protein n=1 Tax=Tetrahymena thermophila (strain SB210) TaxID=312017 RepID=I7MDD3_TETTS|nr:hypothetical protein TTHERM_00058810 [Tetrahymena thermophila SB210]EAR87369.2 hypothetical protein TTHERM_00058810 [Tetrahymena thermophila SB210]|eukprot:XP_001007614.2 hypothetical protein TTHERM_00058810 [Tetrahymena thermophila SB210]
MNEGEVNDQDEEGIIYWNKKVIKKAFNEWKQRLNNKKDMFRKLVIARYEIEFKRKKKIFDYLQYNKSYSYNMRILLMEQSARINQKLKEKVFKGFQSIKQKKEVRSEFFAKICYFYHDFILHKYFNIMKNQKELIWEQDFQKQKANIFWKQSLQRKYFLCLKQAKIMKLQIDREIQKKINICKLIFKKTHARIFIKNLKENVDHRIQIKQQFKQLANAKMKIYFDKLKNYLVKQQIKQKRLQLADSYQQNRVGNLIKQKYFNLLQKIVKDCQDFKRKQILIKKKMLKKYFNSFVSQLEYNFNVNIYYADKHFEQKLAKKFFTALKLYQKIVHYHKIKNQRKIKYLVKDIFNSFKSYWQRCQLETKKRYLITRSRQKFVKQFVWRQWRDQLLLKQAEGEKQKDIQQISNKQYLKKSFQILKNYQINQQVKKKQKKIINKHLLHKYFQLVVKFYLRKKSVQEKERQARKFYFIKSVKQGFYEMKRVYLIKKNIVLKIQQKEQQNNILLAKQSFQILLQNKANKQKKKAKYQNFLNKNVNKQQLQIFNAFKLYSKSKIFKKIDQQKHQKNIQSGLLQRILQSWKNIICLKKNKRTYFQEKSTLIAKKIAFKRFEKNVQEQRIIKRKLRALKLKKMIKMKKLIFTHMKQFLWKKQIKKQEIKEKENLYLAKLLIKSLFAWKLYLKALRRAKQKVKYAIVHWSNQKKKISFKKMQEFLQIKKQKRQEELDAFSLHISHKQNEVLKKVIMMGIEIKESKIKFQKNDLVKIKIREQDLAFKYGRKWLDFYERRKILKKQLNCQNQNKQQIQQQKGLQNIKAQQPKDTIVFDRSNKRQHAYQMSFFPNHQLSKESFQNDSINIQQQNKVFFQQNTPNKPPSSQGNPTFRQGSEDKAKEILNWFDKEFLVKNKLVPKKIQENQQNQDTIQIQRIGVNVKQNNNKITQENVTTAKQQIFSQNQKQSNNIFNQLNEIPVEAPKSQKNNSGYFQNQSNQQIKVRNSLLNVQQNSNHVLHLSNIAQLLDQDHSTTIIEDIKEKNKQLEQIIAEYQNKKQQGNNVRASELKALIQEKLLEIKQLKSNI